MNKEPVKSKNLKLIPKLRFPEFQDAGEWEEIFLGNIFKERVKKNEPQKQVLAATQDRGVIPYDLLEKSIIRENRNLLGYKLVFPGDFVISLRSFEGGFEYSSEEGIISPAYTIIYLNDDSEKSFFRFYFKRTEFVRLIQKFLNLSLRDGKSINYKQASKLFIYLPKSKEQQKIADCLSSIDELVDLYSQKLDALRGYKKGLMQQLFPVEGETVPRLRFTEFLGISKWVRKTLGTLADISTGKCNTQDKVEDGKYPFFVRSDNVEHINSCSFNGEAILTAGDGVGVGKVFHYINGKFDFHQRVYKLSGFDSTTNGRFVYEIFRRDFGPHVLRQSAKNSVDSVRLSMITDMEIPIPTLLAEQQKIADCLSSLDGLIAAQARKVESLKEHKKGLMRQLFPSFEEAAG